MSSLHDTTASDLRRVSTGELFLVPRRDATADGVVRCWTADGRVADPEIADHAELTTAAALHQTWGWALGTTLPIAIDVARDGTVERILGFGAASTSPPHGDPDDAGTFDPQVELRSDFDGVLTMIDRGMAANAAEWVVLVTSGFDGWIHRADPEWSDSGIHFGYFETAPGQVSWRVFSARFGAIDVLAPSAPRRWINVHSSSDGE